VGVLDSLNVDNTEDKVYQVGTLSKNIIGLLNLNIEETAIMLGDDRIKYTSKHAHEFESYANYQKCIDSIPDIILSPDYVSLHPSGKSIEYIKKLDEPVLAAVRIRPRGKLWFRSLYPISAAKLNRYIQEGTAKKV
jgi:hypothetical protein